MAPAHARETRLAELALLVATFFWGISFTFAKDGDDSLNAAAHLPATSPFGPLLLLGTRFTLGGLLWLAVFPQARNHWGARSLLRAILLGVLLALPMSFQVLGLLTTTEAVSAFLTSLTVLFVPLLSTLLLRKTPPLIEWLGVAIATLGIYLMTAPSAPAQHFLSLTPGHLLGIAASIGFAVYILAINHILPQENPHQMTAGQFVACGLITLATVVAFTLVRRSAFEVRHFAPLFTTATPLRSLILLILLPTLTAYGLLNFFQPKVDPTRAALLYLAEPLFAAAYAWLVAGRGMSKLELTVAGLILVANALVEFLKPAER